MILFLLGYILPGMSLYFIARKIDRTNNNWDLKSKWSTIGIGIIPVVNIAFFIVAVIILIREYFKKHGDKPAKW